MGEPLATVERLARVTTDHDLDALVACFADEYELTTPAHPSRSFRGRDQVRRNWEQIFAGVPDIRTVIRASAVNGDVVWTEWEMRGSRRDGTPYNGVGVIVFGVRDDLIRWGRFFIEPVDVSAASSDQAVRQQVART